MLRYLDDLHELAVRGATCDAKAMAAQELSVLVVELIAVSMSFRYFQDAIRLVRQRAGFERAGISTESHRASHVFDTRELSQLDDEFVW